MTGVRDGLPRPVPAGPLSGVGLPRVLQADFRNSLLAAYRVDEVEQQLACAGLGRLDVATISDRHLFVAGVGQDQAFSNLARRRADHMLGEA
jgi:hypothetical protein